MQPCVNPSPKYYCIEVTSVSSGASCDVTVGKRLCTTNSTSGRVDCDTGYYNYVVVGGPYIDLGACNSACPYVTTTTTTTTTTTAGPCANTCQWYCPPFDGSIGTYIPWVLSTPCVNSGSCNCPQPSYGCTVNINGYYSGVMNCQGGPETSTTAGLPWYCVQTYLCSDSACTDCQSSSNYISCTQDTPNTSCIGSGGNWNTTVINGGPYSDIYHCASGHCFDSNTTTTTTTTPTTTTAGNCTTHPCTMNCVSGTWVLTSGACSPCLNCADQLIGGPCVSGTISGNCNTPP